MFCVSKLNERLQPRTIKVSAYFGEMVMFTGKKEEAMGYKLMKHTEITGSDGSNND